MERLEIQKKTLEDLTMLLLEDKAPSLYKRKILPAYELVVSVISSFESKREKAIWYGANLEEDLGFGDNAAYDVGIAVQSLLGKMKTKGATWKGAISNGIIEKFVNPFKIVKYLLSDGDTPLGNKGAYKKVLRVCTLVNTSYKQVISALPSNRRKGVTLETQFSGMDGLDWNLYLGKLEKARFWGKRLIGDGEMSNFNYGQTTVYDLVRFISYKKLSFRCDKR